MVFCFIRPHSDRDNVTQASVVGIEPTTKKLKKWSIAAAGLLEPQQNCSKMSVFLKEPSQSRDIEEDIKKNTEGHHSFHPISHLSALDHCLYNPALAKTRCVVSSSQEPSDIRCFTKEKQQFHPSH